MRITHVQLQEPSKYRSLHPIQLTLTGSCKCSAGFRCHFWRDLCSPELQKARCSFYESRNTFHLQLRCCEHIHLLSEPNEKHFKLVFLSGHIHFFPQLPFSFFFASWGKHSSWTALPLITDKRHPLTHLNTEILLLTSIHYYFQEAGDQILNRKKDLHNYPSHLRIKYFVLCSGLDAYLWNQHLYQGKPLFEVNCNLSRLQDWSGRQFLPKTSTQRLRGSHSCKPGVEDLQK